MRNHVPAQTIRARVLVSRSRKDVNPVAALTSPARILGTHIPFQHRKVQDIPNPVNRVMKNPADSVHATAVVVPPPQIVGL